MLIFKSIADLTKLDPQDPAYPVMKDLIQESIEAYSTPEQPYMPDCYGYLVLVEEADIDQVIHIKEVQCKLIDVRWELVYKRDGFYVAVYLANDAFGLGFVFPDAPWFDGELRKLLDQLVEA